MKKPLLKAFHIILFLQFTIILISYIWHICFSLSKIFAQSGTGSLFIKRIFSDYGVVTGFIYFGSLISFVILLNLTHIKPLKKEEK